MLTSHVLDMALLLENILCATIIVITFKSLCKLEAHPKMVTLVNSDYQDEMPQNAIFHQGLHRRLKTQKPPIMPKNNILNKKFKEISETHAT